MFFSKKSGPEKMLASLRKACKKRKLTEAFSEAINIQIKRRNAIQKLEQKYGVTLTEDTLSEFLKEKDIDPATLPPSQTSVIVVAAEERDTAFLSWLASNGYDLSLPVMVNIAIGSGFISAFKTKEIEKYKETAKFLCNIPMPADMAEQSLLHAIGYKNVECTLDLLNRGARITEFDDKNLLLIVKSGFYTSFEIMMSGGEALLGKRDQAYLAVINQENILEDTIQQLVKDGFDLHQRHGAPLYMLLRKSVSSNAINILLENGACPRKALKFAKEQTNEHSQQHKDVVRALEILIEGKNVEDMQARLAQQQSENARLHEIFKHACLQIQDNSVSAHDAKFQQALDLDLITSHGGRLYIKAMQAGRKDIQAAIEPLLRRHKDPFDLEAIFLAATISALGFEIVDEPNAAMAQEMYQKLQRQHHGNALVGGIIQKLDHKEQPKI